MHHTNSHKKSKLLLFIICSIFLFSACRKLNEYITVKNITTFTDGSFKSVKKVSHKVLNDDFIGDPVRISLINTFLFAVDSKTDTIVHVFSIINDNYIGPIIPRGIGPNELLSVGMIEPSIEKNKFWSYDLTNKLWIENHLDSIVVSKCLIPTKSIRIPQDLPQDIYIDNPVWISDSLFVCSNLNNYRDRYMIFDKQSKLVSSISNPNFIFHEDIPDGILCDIFSTIFDVKPDKSKIALAGRYFDCLEIYNIDGSFQCHLKGPNEKSEVVFNKEKSLNRGVMIKSPETKKIYICIKVSDNKIYALYSGKDRKDPADYNYSNIIYTFDWNGMPLDKIILDTEIGTFDIDEENKKIYAIMKPDNCVIEFDLN